MPRYAPDLNQIQYWIMGIAGSITLFLSVLVHELSHSLAARSYGIRVKQIILFIFGGVSDIEEEPKDFKKEFKWAIAGTLISLGLSMVFALLWSITNMIITQSQSASPVEDFSILLLTMVNAILY